MFPVNDFHSLEEVIQVFKGSRSSAKFNRASIAIANPIMGDMITMTNSHWTFSIEKTRESCGLERVAHAQRLGGCRAVPTPPPPSPSSVKSTKLSEVPHGNKALLG